MKLLVDTDAFCKLTICGIFEDALLLLGVKLHECGRLPALPYMLRRGKLPRQYGEPACASMGEIATGLPAISRPGDAFLEPLNQIDEIDVGEAQLYAAAAEHGLLVLSGDIPFTLTVTGTDFLSGARVRWNGTDRVTTFVSPTQLQAGIPATDLATAGTIPVAVINPDGGESNGSGFDVIPELVSLPITPAAVAEGNTSTVSLTPL